MNPILRATARGLTVARDLARRGLSMVDPEVSRELSERGLAVTGNGSAPAPEPAPSARPSPPPDGTPDSTRSNGHSDDVYLSMETQLAVASSLASAADPEEAMPRVLSAVGESFGLAAGGYWAPDGEEHELRCRATWRSGDGDQAAVMALTGNPVLEPAQLPRQGSFAVPLTNGEQGLGYLEFFPNGTTPDQQELSKTLSAVGAQVSQFIARRAAEAEVENLKDEFFALVSHELRTPLTSIVGYTEMLGKIDGKNLSEKGLSFVDVIRRNAKREMRLIGDLLVLVRIQAGTFEIEPGTVDVRRVVLDSIETARPMAEKGKVELTVETDEVRPSAGDAERLAQAVDNLLSNAIKFTPEGGRVHVRLLDHGESCTIEVTDTGVGIPEEDHSRLFDRLYRASSATEAHVPGTGLGLTIVKAIVEAHGGQVTVASQLHQGSTFRVELPLEAAE